MGRKPHTLQEHPQLSSHAVCWGAPMILLSFHYKIVPHHGTCGLLPPATPPAGHCRLGVGGNPLKALFKARSRGKADSSRGKGISEQWVSQSQPPSYTASLFWLPSAHTRPQGCAIAPAHGDKGTQGTQCILGSHGWPPTPLLPWSCTGSHPQDHSTWSSFCTPGHQPAGCWVASLCFGEWGAP